MTIHAGLFKLDMTDHYAVLGFSLAANPQQVRKRYLGIARQLHPDSLREASDQQKRLASELLSKWVNPAYEILSQEKAAAEYRILLKIKQKQLVEKPDLLSLLLTTGSAATQLMQAQNVEADYAAAVQALAAEQFSDLTQVKTVINQLSELNAVYLMRRGAAQKSAEQSGQATSSLSSGVASSVPSGSPEKVNAAKTRAAISSQIRAQSGIVDSYLNRAQEFEAQADYSRAILELREVINSHPKSAPCHAHLASLYLKSGQATMAKIHAKQALTLDPANALAQTVQAKLGVQTADASKVSTKAAKAGAKQGGNQGGNQGEPKKGGLLSGLFGGKKR
ncbi:MAG: molecular chaperone DnaJ [Phormidesmis priestleyi]|uniref:Molecular chaperone DnaJ n=1 Tax=Phormidesmis priestleyi TaxID=268141 RepID=A0A2W4WFX1_9CYAN|nr:MAG: molecular chaperone DnaJ [Phormidesmis priestleyi]